MVNFLRMFRRMDDDGSNSLKFEEFHKGIVETGLNSNEAEAKQMFKRFDKDGSGTVNIDEFLMAIRVRFHRSTDSTKINRPGYNIRMY